MESNSVYVLHELPQLGGNRAGLPRAPILTAGFAVSPRGTVALSYVCPEVTQPTGGPPHCPQGLTRGMGTGQSWQFVS